MCIHKKEKEKKKAVVIPLLVAVLCEWASETSEQVRVKSTSQQHFSAASHPHISNTSGEAMSPLSCQHRAWNLPSWWLDTETVSPRLSDWHSWPLITDAYAHTYTAYSHWIAILCTLSNKTGSLSSHSQFLESSAWSEAFREVLTRVLGLCAFISACLF